MKFARAAALLSFSVLSTFAFAGDIKPYSQQTFDTLTQAGKPVVVDVSATWCPTCKAQKPILDGLMQQPAYKDVTLLTVDYDDDKPVLKKFNVRQQSTLVAFKGAQEVARSTGDTSAAGLDALVKKTLN